jgi:hypothetical protein
VIRCRARAILAVLGLLIALNSGCLSLSMLNRETPETKSRIDSLEQRVSALETAIGQRPAQPPTLSSRPSQVQPSAGNR